MNEGGQSKPLWEIRKWGFHLKDGEGQTPPTSDSRNFSPPLFFLQSVILSQPLPQVTLDTPGETHFHL